MNNTGNTLKLKPMTRKIFAFIMVLIPCVTFSQINAVQKISGTVEKVKLTEFVFKYSPVASDENSFSYLLLPNEESIGKYGKYYRIEKYDMDLNLINRVQIDLTQGDHEKRFNELIYFHDTLYLFSSFRNEMEGKVYLFVQTMDKNSFEVNDDIQKIAELSYDTSIKNFILRTDYAISEDGSKLLIYTYPDNIKYVQLQGRPDPKDVEEKRQYMYVFDENLNLLWEQEAGKAVNSGVFVFDKYNIDNDASVYITGRTFEDTEEIEEMYMYSRRKGLSDRYYTYVQPSNYRHSVLYFGNEGKSARQLDLNPDDIFPKSITVEAHGDYLICAGVYAEPNTISAKGIFTCQLNLATGSTENLKLVPFEDKYVYTRLDTSDLKKFHKITNTNEWDPFSYDLTKLIKTGSDDYVFIAEQQLHGQLESNSGKMISYYPTHNYRDLYSVRITSDGDIKQIVKVEKNQFGLLNIASSYSHNVVDDTIYLLFNNMPPKVGLMKVAELQNTCLIELDSEGEQKQEFVTLFEKADKNTLFMRSTAVLTIPRKPEFIYPLQGNKYKYRTYERISIN
jgi:hypothetical protein